MEKLTEFFDYCEFGITDETDISIKENIKKLVVNVMEKIQAEYGMSIFITSGYRTCPHERGRERRVARYWP